MDELNFDLASKLVEPSYIHLARDAHRTRLGRVRQLLSQRRLPERGWGDADVRWLMGQLAAMDSNQFPEQVGVGEREGRVYSSVVRERHWGMAHGMGRAGDVNADQPKAAGASLLVRLAQYLVRDAIRRSGFESCRAVGLLPVATGMALTLCLLALRRQRPGCRRVLWLRVDQKSCLKCVTAADCEPVVVEGRLQGDQVVTDTEALQRAWDALPAVSDENGTGDTRGVLCVLSTTSCFAPRAPDDVVRIAQWCQAHDVAHVVNNAYGLQARRCCGRICAASRAGRVDVVVQSFDKNFMVPVGGAVLAARHSDTVQRVLQLYPGRASVAPVADLFITLLQMGADGYAQLLREREHWSGHFRRRVAQVAQRYGERLLHTDDNSISFAMTLQHIAESCAVEPAHIGSMLYARRCSGPRAILATERRCIEGIEFIGYGAHVAHYPCAYLSMACAIGITQRDVEVFCERLDAVLRQVVAVQRVSRWNGPLNETGDHVSDADEHR